MAAKQLRYFSAPIVFQLQCWRPPQVTIENALIEKVSKVQLLLEWLYIPTATARRQTLTCHIYLHLQFHEGCSNVKLVSPQCDLCYEVFADVVNGFLELRIRTINNPYWQAETTKVPWRTQLTDQPVNSEWSTL